MGPGTAHNSAINAIEQYRQQIVSDLLERVLQDPFWEERFGPQVRAFAETDANRHVDNLLVALRFEMGDSTARHYNYLQSIMVNRGVCTRLIREAIDKLKLALVEILPEYWEQIEPYLNAGYEGIVYSDPTSIALTNCEQSLAGAVVERLLRELKFKPPDPGWQDSRYRDVLILVSYLADALERHSVPIFADYIKWLTALREKEDNSDDLLDREINLLSKEITRQLAPLHARRLRTIIRQVTRA